MSSGFSLFELVLVIVVISILSTVVLKREYNDNLYKAALQVSEHIRYTQHLALVDDKFNAFDKFWYKHRWQIIFGKSAFSNDTVSYSIFSDSASGSTGQPDITEMAIDPQNIYKVLSGGYSGILYSSDPRATRDMNIGERYGVVSYKLSGGCSGARISFDYLGRPIKGNLNTMSSPYLPSNRLMSSICEIKLSSTEEYIIIKISPETGYVYIESKM